MSYDYDLMPSNCNHLQMMERMRIEEDNRTLYNIDTKLRMRAPINGRNTVILRFNGVEIPSNDPQYGWTIQDDELSIEPDKRSKIVFNNSVRIYDMLIELEYVTTKPYCRKCSGKAIVNDYQVADDGSFKKIIQSRKLVQKIYKFIFTSKCYFYPNLTTGLKNYIGKKFGTTSLGPDDISFEITNALTSMKSVQSSQAQIQNLDPQEILRDIKSISVVRDSNDPTIVNVDMDVLTYSGDQAKVDFGIRIS